MSSPEQQGSPEKKKSGFLKTLGKIALFAFGLAVGAEVANSSLLGKLHIPKPK